MAHTAQQEFCKVVKAIFPEYFDNVDVCDIGSLDINGNNHYLFKNYSYIGVDIGRGKNVNIISKAHEFKPINGKFDIVISTECLEHDMYWAKTITNVCENLLKDNGLFLMTCATTGRPEHGTAKTNICDSPLTSITEGWSDYYMNLTEEDIIKAIDLKNYFKIWHFYTHEESHDLYFWAIKH